MAGPTNAGFFEGLVGTLSQGIEKKHVQEEKNKEQRRQDLWKVIQSPDFSDESKQQAWKDLQGLSNPESKKGLRKIEDLFQKLKPPAQNPTQGNGGLLGTGGVPGQQSQQQGKPFPNALQAPVMANAQQPPAQTPPQAVNASQSQAQGQLPSKPLQPPALAGPMTQQQKSQREIDTATAKEKAEEPAIIFKTNEEIRKSNALKRQEQEMKDQAEEKLEKAAKDYATALGPEEGKAFLKRFEEQHKFGLKSDEAKPPAPEDIKNIPGKALKGQKDAFGGDIDDSVAYTKSKDGKLYPETAAPKAPPGLTGALKQSVDAYHILASSKDPSEIKGAQEALKAQAQKATEAQARVAAANGAGGQISDDDLKTLAESNAITGGKTELSYRDPAMKAKYEHYYAEAIRNAGGPQAISEVQAQYKASRGNLESLEKIQGQMKAAQAGTIAEIDRLVDLSRKVPRSQAKLFNNYAQLIQADLTDYPELASYREALVAARDRYTSMIGTFKGGGASTNQMKTETAEEILNRDMPQGALEAAAKEMKVGITNVMKGLDDVVNQTRKDMASPSKPSPSGAQTPPGGGSVVDQLVKKYGGGN
jgi:hypothetical protein